MKAIGILALGCAAAFGQSGTSATWVGDPITCAGSGCTTTLTPASITILGPKTFSSGPDRVNETLKPSKTYNAAGASILLIAIPTAASGIDLGAGVGGGHTPPLSTPGLSFMVAVASKRAATHAIVEVYYWTVANLGGKDLRLLRASRQVVGLYGDAMCLSDPFDIELSKVEKVEIRLVTETGLSEFWNHTESAGAK